MITAIVCAAGKGARTGFCGNKILRELNGLPVLSYSLSAFAQNEAIDEIIIVCRKEDEREIEALFRPYRHNGRIVEGGETRTESVFRALKAAHGDVVLVHDAARPYLTQRMIDDCIATVKDEGSGVCAVPVTDTVAIAKDGRILETPDRKTLYAVQTPQGFYKDKLLQAFSRAYEEEREKEFTDESGMYAAYIAPPALCSGDPKNKKLTYAEDFFPCERVGFGVDTHRFYTSEEAAPFVAFITLGGVRVPSDKILKAHSDGDVLLHALMDALLSAAGLRDIGCYFPDTDECYRGADSLVLLKEVMRLVKEAGLAPMNASISILAETPRLSPYIERMKETLAPVLGLPLFAIGIAAGTNEKLGYIGEGKGITCYATVLCSQKLCSQNLSNDKFS